MSISPIINKYAVIIQDNMKKFSLIALFTLLTAQVPAQGVFEFLNLEMSPRSGALAGSFTAANDDPDIIFSNPAGLYGLEGTPVSFSYLKHVLDFNFASLSGSYEIKDFGRLSAGVKYANFGTFTEADEYGNKFSEYGAADIMFVTGYANEIDKNFHYGVNLKFIYSGIADYSSTAIAGDLGLQYLIPDENWVFAIAFRNFGTQLSSYIETKENLPLEMAVGISKRLQYLPLRLFVDFGKLNEEQDSFLDRFKAFTFGGEFTLSKAVKLRVGFDAEKRRELKVGSFAGLAGFNVGLGFNVQEYHVSYAYSSFGEIGALHRFGVSTNL